MYIPRFAPILLKAETSVRGCRREFLSMCGATMEVAMSTPEKAVDSDCNPFETVHSLLALIGASFWATAERELSE